MLEKTLESPLDCKGIKPVNPKENQSRIFIGRTDAEAETLILWPPDAKNWLIGKDPDAGQDWKQEEKGMTEDEMVEWHHWLDGHEFENVLGAGDGQGSLDAAVQGAPESQTGLSDWSELNNREKYQFVTEWNKKIQIEILCLWVGKISTEKISILSNVCVYVFVWVWKWKG